MLINLSCGDESGDGHDKSQTVTIEILSNHNINDLITAYELGSKKLGFDFTNEVCEEYEDSKILPEYLDKLLSLGFVRDKDMDEDYGICELNTEEYLRIYLFIVELGNPDIKTKFYVIPTIYIGGYGLFE